MRTAPDSALVEALLGRGAVLVTVVDPRDEMFRVLRDAVGSRARFDYFRLGHELLDTVEQIVDWAFPGERGRISIMEFACGYGRNVRHLVRAFPAANISVSDIDADAVAFVGERFGVEGKVSADEPERLGWEERYDLVVVPSLFSHLPDRTFARWLAFLHGLLTERGVLAFSVHDARLEPDADFSSGIAFRPINEAPGRLDPEQYGSATVTETYVADRIETATGARRYGRIPRGFWDFQDVYLVTGPQQRDPALFRYAPPIVGHVDHVGLSGGTVEVRGWARATAPGLRATIRVGNDLLGEIEPSEPRPDVAAVRGDEFLHSGFAVTLRLPRAGAARRPVVVDAAAGDLRRCLYAGAATRPPRRLTARRVAGAVRAAVGR